MLNTIKEFFMREVDPLEAIISKAEKEEWSVFFSIEHPNYSEDITGKIGEKDFTITRTVDCRGCVKTSTFTCTPIFKLSRDDLHWLYYRLKTIAENQRDERLKSKESQERARFIEYFSD